MMKDINQLTEFLLELDALKTVERKNYIAAGFRHENSAEHSWHLAMACWCFNRYFDLQLSEEKLLKLALIHDLGEIDAGDTFLYATTRSNAHEKERECIDRLTQHQGNSLKNLLSLWEEQETGNSAETRLLKTVDRLLPFLLNIVNKGKTWREMNVKKSQVVAAHAFIKSEFPQIHEWLSQQLEQASSEGWLIE